MQIPRGLATVIGAKPASTNPLGRIGLGRGGRVSRKPGDRLEGASRMTSSEFGKVKRISQHFNPDILIGSRGFFITDKGFKPLVYGVGFWIETGNNG